MEITGKTRVVGVIGHPVAHSLSAPMHNAAFAEAGLDWVYVAFPVAPEGLAAAYAGLRALGVTGFNATIPHKVGLLGLVDRLTPEAKSVGSVNTVCFDASGEGTGHSTDGAGFLRALREEGCDPEGMRVALLGAGGAARAVLGALVQAGAAQVVCSARRREAAEGLVAMDEGGGGRVSVAGWEAREEAARSADLIVNATPLGMHGHDEDATALHGEALRAGQWVCDLVYTPLETRLLREAKERGCRVVAGTGMLVHQGAEAFTLWTGIAAPVETMRRALLASLAERNRGE